MFGDFLDIVKAQKIQDIGILQKKFLFKVPIGVESFEALPHGLFRLSRYCGTLVQEGILSLFQLPDAPPLKAAHFRVEVSLESVVKIEQKFDM